MAGSDAPDRPLTDAELASFREALNALEERVSAFLAEGSDQTAGEIDAAVDESPMPDPLEDRPVDAADDDSA